MSSEEVDGVAGDLLEKYWFLDSFGADLVLEMKWMVRGKAKGSFGSVGMIMVGVPILRRFSFI